MKALPLSDAGHAIPSDAEVEIFHRSGKRETLKLRSLRHDKGFLIASFEGIDRREDAALLRDAVIHLQKKLLPALSKNEYYHWQIIGLTVITDQGITLGKVVEIMETGSHDVFIVQGSGKEFLIPAVKDMVSSIDLEAGMITISPIDGLLD